MMVIPHYGFEDRILVLIILVPGHLFYFLLYSSECVTLTFSKRASFIARTQLFVALALKPWMINLVFCDPL